MSQISFFDCNCWIGRPAKRHAKEPMTAGELLAAMNYYSIEHALVHENASVEGDPDTGNALLLDEIRDFPRLLPVAVVAPYIEKNAGEVRKILGDYVARGFRAFQVFPKGNSFSVNSCYAHILFGAMERFHLPLLMEYEQVAFDGIDRFAAQYKNLKIILVRASHFHDRNLYALVRAHANIFVEISQQHNHRGVNEFVRHFSAKRLLFGSSYPKMSPGAAMGLTTLPAIKDDEKRMIAGENLKRLLGLDSKRCDAMAEKDKGFIPWEKKWRPEIENLKQELIIDAHAHFMSWYQPIFSQDDMAMIVRSMDELGIDKLTISEVLGYTNDNELTRRFMKAYPDRIIGRCCINPNYPDEVARIIKRDIEEFGMQGFKIHSHHGHPPGHPAYDPMWRYAQKNRLSVKAHTWGHDQNASPEAFERILAKYPKVILIMGHAGGGEFDDHDPYIDFANKHRNVYLEITYSQAPYRRIEHLVERAGEDKVLFGSDAFMRGFESQLGWVFYADITREQKKKILGLNLQGILDQARPAQYKKRNQKERKGKAW